MSVVRNDPAIDSIVPADLKAERLAEGFPVYRGSRLGARGIPAIQRSERQHDLSMVGQRWIVGVQNEERIHGSGHRRIRTTRLEWPGARSRRAPDHQRTRQSPRQPSGEDWRADGPGRSLRRQATEQPERSRLRSDGSLYFTDPPFGLPKFSDDARKELAVQWRLSVRSADNSSWSAEELKGPNGLAFSPDEKYLYVGNWDEKNKVVMRYAVKSDGTLANGEVFFDMTSAPGEDAIDGVKVDSVGMSTSRGREVFGSSRRTGKHLGTIVTPEHAHNFAWGDDGRSLYVTARSTLYRIRLNVAGRWRRQAGHELSRHESQARAPGRFGAIAIGRASRQRDSSNAP